MRPGVSKWFRRREAPKCSSSARKGGERVQPRTRAPKARYSCVKPDYRPVTFPPIDVPALRASGVYLTLPRAHARGYFISPLRGFESNRCINFSKTISRSISRLSPGFDRLHDMRAAKIGHHEIVLFLVTFVGAPIWRFEATAQRLSYSASPSRIRSSRSPRHRILRRSLE
jgi:hypothetical protein